MFCVNSTINAFRNDIPIFNYLESTSSIFDNREITPIIYSEQNTLLLFIQKMFYTMLEYIYPVEKTNYAGIVAAFDRGNESGHLGLKTLGPKGFHSYFRRFIDGEQGSENAVRCIDQITDQYSAIEKALVQRATGWVDEDSVDPRTEAYQRLTETVLSIEVGQQAAMVLPLSMSEEMFVLFARDESGYRVKIIGRGDVMTQLSGVQEVLCAGKAKICSSLTFTNVSREDVQSLLTYSPLTLQEVDISAFQGLLSRLNCEETDDNLSTKTEDFSKVFWTLLKEVGKNDGKQRGDHVKLKLRSKLYTLFDMTQNYMKSFTHTEKDTYLLDRMLRICAKELLSDHQKGLVSEEELRRLQLELRGIEGELAPPSGNLLAHSISVPSLLSYEIESPRALPTTQLEQVSVGSSLRAPAPSPESNNIVVNWNPTNGISTLAELTENSPPSEIVETIYSINFLPYSNEDVYWKNITLEEAVQMLEKLHEISTALVKSAKPPKKLPFDVYQAMVKITFMIAFLDFEKIGEGNQTEDRETLLGTLVQFPIVPKWAYVSKQRTISSSHSKDAQIKQEMRDFVTHINLHTLNSSYQTSLPDNQILPALQRQFAQLKQLTQHLDIHSASLWGVTDPLGKFASLSLLFDWEESLPLSLLACYHYLGIAEELNGEYNQVQIGRGYIGQSHVRTTFDERYTEEAIGDDPFSTLDEFTKHTLNYIEGWRDGIDTDLCFHEQDEEEDYQAKMLLLKRQLENLRNATNKEVDLSENQLRDLLLILRHENPQILIVRYLEKHADMLLNPTLQHFLQLVFLEKTSLNNSLEGRLEGQARSILPKFFAEKIQNTFDQIEDKPEEAVKFLFFLQMSEWLKDIYLEKEYEVDDFFKIETIQNDLQQLRNLPYMKPHLPTFILLEMNDLLRKESLTEKEIAQLFIDRQYLLSPSAAKASYEKSQLFFLEAKFHRLINQMPAPLSSGYVNYVLDAICTEKQLPFDRSQWTGSGTNYENDQYAIDLKTGTVRDKRLGYTAGHLPNEVVHDLLFKKNFPGFKEDATRVMVHQEENGLKTYLFKEKAVGCQVTEGPSGFTYYKTFGDKLLQLVDLTVVENHLFSSEFGTQDQSPEEAGGMYESAMRILEVAYPKAKLPAILRSGVYIDPQNPSLGYIAQPGGEIEYEIEISGDRIAALYDVRGGERSESLEVTDQGTVAHPALKALEQFEAPSQILIWSKKPFYLSSFFFNPELEKIELPRYGITFAVKEGELICTSPKYAGYKVDLSASLRDRRNFRFSLLLKSEDSTKPSILLAPKTERITQQNGFAYPTGFAFIVWLLKLAYSLYFKGEMPNLSAPELSINEEGGDHIAAFIHPITGEISFERGKEMEHSQELMKQAILLGEEQLSYEIFHSCKIEKEMKVLRKWGAFAKRIQSPHTSLAILGKILPLMEEGEKRKELTKAQVDIFKEYLALGQKIPGCYRLSKERFDELAHLVKQEDPNYFQKHLTPYYLERETAFTLPIIYADGRQTELPQLIEAPSIRNNSVTLEQRIAPNTRLSDEDLCRGINLIENPEPLLFDTIQNYFDAERSITSSQALLNNEVNPKLTALQREYQMAKSALDHLLTNSTDELDQLAIFSKEKRIATQTELMMALVQDDLGSLRENLPKGLEPAVLKQALVRFFDLEVKVHILTKCQKELSYMIENRAGISDDLWQVKSTALFDLLSHKRKYSPEANPELLIFEVMHFLTFRETDAVSQLSLLKQLLENPSAVVQAGTGSGKSSVLSILRSFMLANGKNLVTQKVLPHLYGEMEDLYESRLQGSFKRKFYPFRFDLTKPLKNENGSIFKSIYQRMLETIENRGCILTDYKSMPLLEEKFWSLSREFIAKRAENIEPSALEKEHFEYLKKILILQQNKEVQLMDEFDEPNRPVHRIQMQISPGTKPPAFMLQESMRIYAKLRQETALHLEGNLQGEIPEETRLECIKNVALQFANERARGNVTQQELYRYFIGESEEVLTKIATWSNEEKDVLAFYQDQFFTYLPLTLNSSGITRYKRSPDGKRILTCINGEVRQAKFGNIIEEINYTIQEYLQHKVALPTVRDSILSSMRDYRNGVPGTQERFAEIIPGVSLEELCRFTPDDLEDQIENLHNDVNQRDASVLIFLENHLRSLTSSGVVSSMTPQDIISMSRAVSGVSATVGSLGALHEQFRADTSSQTRVYQQMIDRFRRRAEGQTIFYRPSDPLRVLEQQNDLSVIIDGSGAFRELPAKTVAQKLLDSNSTLKKVEYFDEEGTLQFVGRQIASLEQTGFYFMQKTTTGTDKQFSPSAKALLTVSEKEGMERLAQQEGRMRGDGQKIVVALSEFAPTSMRSIDKIIEQKKKNDKKAQAVDRFRSEPQRLRHMMRHEAKKTLLAKEELVEFLDTFDQTKDLFIQAPSANYENPGDYFARHGQIIRSDKNPIDELNGYKNQLILRSEGLNLSTLSLQNTQYTEQMQEQMPQTVAPISSRDTQLEVEEEMEEETQFELENEREEETQTRTNTTKVSSYLPRTTEYITHSAKDKIHGAFDGRITFTEAFLPLNRTDPLHKRKPFDSRMLRVGAVSVYWNWGGVLGTDTLNRIEIGDLLDEEKFRSNEDEQNFTYDVHTKKVLNGGILSTEQNNISNSDEFANLTAQIRFLDGQIEGYSEKEVIALKNWLTQNGTEAEELQSLFENKIIRYHDETRLRFRHSQLWNVFNQLQITA